MGQRGSEENTDKLDVLGEMVTHLLQTPSNECHLQNGDNLRRQCSYPAELLRSDRLYWERASALAVCWHQDSNHVCSVCSEPSLQLWKDLVPYSLNARIRLPSTRLQISRDGWVNGSGEKQTHSLLLTYLSHHPKAIPLGDGASRKSYILSYTDLQQAVEAHSISL